MSAKVSLLRAECSESDEFTLEIREHTDIFIFFPRSETSFARDTLEKASTSLGNPLSLSETL